ncbi:hypothetical protein predicted by Glimmer/Critica [Sorangium cellulosum So ce56]|uniref:Uncharacterized protein n=1 Tax=Sorangium cellulosum (strain So ce56) TaxID=448385 RepID=A9GKH8_SORC5|nr:hypothetical protein predicted by Glimmer/Critica [Sorangium cellulosum So ce56]
MTGSRAAPRARSIRPSIAAATAKRRAESRARCTESRARRARAGERRRGIRVRGGLITLYAERLLEPRRLP